MYVMFLCIYDTLRCVIEGTEEQNEFLIREKEQLSWQNF